MSDKSIFDDFEFEDIDYTNKGSIFSDDDIEYADDGEMLFNFDELDEEPSNSSDDIEYADDGEMLFNFDELDEEPSNSDDDIEYADDGEMLFNFDDLDEEPSNSDDDIEYADDGEMLFNFDDLDEEPNDNKGYASIFSNHEEDNDEEFEFNFDELDENKILFNGEYINLANISVEYVKGLIFNEEIIGYRVRTNQGLFDISLNSAREHGLYNYRVTKGIKVQKYEGYNKYLSKSEYENNMVVPDISNEDKLCTQIIGILLTL